MIPYGRQLIDDNDIDAVIEVLHSDWLTTGPKVAEFEKAVAAFVGAKYAVSVSSGTAALHCAMYAIDIRPGDEVIVPAITFAATANCVIYQGGNPVIVDVDPDTLLIDPEKAEAAITEKTRAIVTVDFSGHPADYDTFKEIAKKYNLFLIADACHALGAEYNGHLVGSLADITLFSFHPVKHITTGEGGMAVTHDEKFASRMRRFRNQGIDTDFKERETKGSWYYEMVDLGFNYRLTDIQCALGISQLRRLEHFIMRREEIADAYNDALAFYKYVAPLKRRKNIRHAWHLFVVKLDKTLDRSKVYTEMRKAGIGVNVHYIPVHLHPFYRSRFDTRIRPCPTSEEAYQRILTLPLWPGMSDNNIKEVLNSLKETTERA